MVAVGAIDGRLHLFATDTGKELLAYLPGNLFSTGKSQGYHYLTDPDYSHRYYVDGTPAVSDVYISSRFSSAPQWRSVLVGIEGSGGRGLFALDVTKPDRFEEANATHLVLWEFSSEDDPHLGLYTWGEETGEDFDLKTGEANLCESIKRLVACSPKSETCILLNLGDFFHSDTMDNRTSRSGHALDVDTRWSKVLRAGVRAMMTCIEAAAKKHQRVIVKNLIGNHDDHTSQMLGLALALFYEGNDRIEVHDDPRKFWFYRFHNVLIGAAHGDTTKPAQLPGIMATDRAEDWGETKHRYFYTGHIHTQNVAEYPGCIWESFKTLAAKDSWTSSKGYRSGRDGMCIVHHKDHGEVERHRVDVAML